MISGRFWPRLATFVVGLSAFYTLIFLLPHLHHLAFNLLATVNGAAGGGGAPLRPAASSHRARYPTAAGYPSPLPNNSRNIAPV